MDHKPSGHRGYALDLLLRSLAILGIAVAIAAVNLLSNPRSPKYGEGVVKKDEILLSSIKPEDNAVWIDSRSKADYDEKHVEGAILLNMDDFYVQLSDFLSQYKGEQMCVVYCASEACDTSHDIVRMIKKETGINNVYALHGGWEEIQKQELTLRSKAEEENIARQKAQEEKIAREKARREAEAKEAAEQIRQQIENTPPDGKEEPKQ